MTQRILSAALYSIGFAALGYLIYILVQSNNVVDGLKLTTALAVVFICFAFANVERVTSINLLGMKVNLAEAKRVVAEANEAVVQLRQLSVALSEILIEELAGDGRWGGAGAEQKETQKQQLLATLVELKVAPAEIKRAAAADRVWVIIDYVSAICNRIPIDTQHTEAWNKWWANYSRGLERPSADECERMLRQFDMLTPERREWLKDYRYYLRNGKHRRHDAWINRDRREIPPD